MPFGVIGAMTVQRVISYGKWSGIVSGMGSSAADTIYACIGAFGLTIISDFLITYQTAINILGSLFILFIGTTMFFKNKQITEADQNAKNDITLFLSSFAVGITNPTAILSFIFAFSYFGITQMNIGNGISLVLGIFIGTLIWWIVLTILVQILKKKFINYGIIKLNKIFSIILILFSIVIFLQTIIK